MKEHVIELFKFPRWLTGQGFDDALEYINKHIPLNIHEWKPKEKIWTWVVPDKGLKVGEHTIQGSTHETIILPIHLDHPHMANDNLSGVVVAMELISKLFDKKTKYNYKFLFLPETIGTMAWLSRYGTDYKYGIVVDSVGTDGPIVTTQTKTPSLLNYYIEGKSNTFMSDAHLMTGNDERALESVNIPSIHITRAPFKEYHSKEDTPDIISGERLQQALKHTLALISRIENDFIPRPTYQGVPCLSTNGLWKKEYETPSNFVRIERIWHSLNSGLSIAGIAKLTGLPFSLVYSFVMELRKKGLVRGHRT